MPSLIFWLLFALFIGLCLALVAVGSTPIKRALDECGQEPDDSGVERANPSA